ncbi:hypothetical protein Pla108_37510 [Botrimarina colliarenosi]|uniref:Uncharacterized protein n=1 Tax=Botrimarina colliarenosi TaxID=2528001 RepID=A0A5C6A3C2_9BACT|nr:hypothetical protein Pla108_37510 [Botrimarina colliarenosi]
MGQTAICPGDRLAARLDDRLRSRMLIVKCIRSNLAALK